MSLGCIHLDHATIVPFHRDENLRLQENLLLVLRDGHAPSVKLADFGVSATWDEENDRVRDTAGTVAFMPPEMCSGKGDFSLRQAGMRGSAGQD